MGQLELQQPRLILLIGTLAIEQFISQLPGRSLDVLVGQIFEPAAGGPLLLPLPHPSGASRWFNHPGHRVLLERALVLLGKTWPDSWSRAQAKLHPDLTEYERPSGSVEEGAVELKSAEQILESIFGPTPQASPMEQAERTLRRPKRVVYTAMSNRNFHWRMHVTKFVLDEGCVPVNPFMLFDGATCLHYRQQGDRVEAMNNRRSSARVLDLGQMSLGVKVQVGIAKRPG